MIAAARPDWTPTPVKEDDVDKPAQAVIKPVIKEKKPEKVVQAEQADWIKRYLAQQQEVCTFKQTRIFICFFI